MSGWKPKTFKDGLSQENNRVALPIVNSFIDTYDNLPAGLWPGFSAELEGMKAVLAKNGGTERAENIVMQSAASLGHEDNPATGAAAVSGSNKKGSTDLYVQQDSIPANGWVGREVYIAGHPFPYRVVKNSASAETTNLVRLELNIGLLKDVTLTTDLSLLRNIFIEPVVGAANSGKALGMTFSVVPPNHWYWLVYYGRVLKETAAGIEDGDYLIKGAAGNVAKLSLSGNAEDFDAEIIGRLYGYNIIELDIRGIAA